MDWQEICCESRKSNLWWLPDFLCSATRRLNISMFKMKTDKQWNVLIQGCMKVISVLFCLSINLDHFASLQYNTSRAGNQLNIWINLQPLLQYRCFADASKHFSFGPPRQKFLAHLPKNLQFKSHWLCICSSLSYCVMWGTLQGTTSKALD